MPLGKRGRPSRTDPGISESNAVRGENQLGREVFGPGYDLRETYNGKTVRDYDRPYFNDAPDRASDW